LVIFASLRPDIYHELLKTIRQTIMCNHPVHAKVSSDYRKLRREQVRRFGMQGVVV